MSDTNLYPSISFAPTFLGNTNPGEFAYSLQAGIVRRTGDLCLYYVEMRVSAVIVPAAGSLYIAGLPVVPSDFAVGSIAAYTNLNPGEGYQQLGIAMRGVDGFSIRLFRSGSGKDYGTEGITEKDVPSAAVISGTYIYAGGVFPYLGAWPQ